MKEKIPWPGEWCIRSAAMYKSGQSTDKSGVDALNDWAQTATEQEISEVVKKVQMGNEVSFSVKTSLFDRIIRKIWSR